MATATKTREVTTEREAGVTTTRTREGPVRQLEAPEVRPPRRDRVRFSTNRVLAAVVALLVVAGLAALGVVVYDRVTTDTGAETTRTFEGVSFETMDHAADVASAARELDALRNVAVAVPSMGAALHEDIALLELVTTGKVPVEASQAAPYVEPDTSSGHDSWESLIAPAVEADTSSVHDSWLGGVLE